MRDAYQKVPEWIWKTLNPLLRRAVTTSTRRWKKVLHEDPCSYCGDAGGEMDHILPRVRRGATSWQNVTGACRRCNVAKGSQKLMQFLVGQRPGGVYIRTTTSKFAGLVVAIADLRAIPSRGPRPKRFTQALAKKMLEEHPGADGALLYAHRRNNNGEQQYLHILRTREQGADAGALCRQFGGRGSAEQGGFTANRPMYDENRRAA